MTRISFLIKRVFFLLTGSSIMVIDLFERRVGTTQCQLGKADENSVDALDGRFVWLRGGHSSLCTDRRAARTYRTIDSPELRTSMLATTPIVISKLATARVFCYPLLNVDRSGLLTICIYSHARSLRSTTAKTCYTLPPRILSHHHWLLTFASTLHI